VGIAAGFIVPMLFMQDSRTSSSMDTTTTTGSSSSSGDQPDKGSTSAPFAAEKPVILGNDNDTVTMAPPEAQTVKLLNAWTLFEDDTDTDTAPLLPSVSTSVLAEQEWDVNAAFTQVARSMVQNTIQHNIYFPELPIPDFSRCRVSKIVPPIRQTYLASAFLFLKTVF
jgi:hypothetical protein